MEEFKNKEYYDKLNDKDKKRFHKLYLKYRNDEEKVIRIMNYEEKIERIGLVSVLLEAYVIYSIQSDLNKFYFSGGFSDFEYLLLFAGMVIPFGMGIYKYFYIQKEMNRIIAIVISIIVSSVISDIAISWIENFIRTVITM